MFLELGKEAGPLDCTIKEIDVFTLASDAIKFNINLI